MDADAQRTHDGAALVTGAAGGIGSELARLFAADGRDLVLVDVRREAVETLSDDLAAGFGVDATPIVEDLSEPEAARAVRDAVRSRGVAVDTLVNNAGFGIFGRFSETDLETELDLIQVNVAAVTQLTKLFLREMLDRGGGRILNTASVAGFTPVPTSAVYAASKHYVLAFSEALAEELRGENVTVTALCPGETDTGFMERGNMEETAFEADDPMDPAEVARAGYEGLLRGDRMVVPGRKNKLRLFLKRLLPRKVYARAAMRAWNR